MGLGTVDTRGYGRSFFHAHGIIKALRGSGLKFTVLIGIFPSHSLCRKPTSIARSPMAGRDTIEMDSLDQLPSSADPHPSSGDEGIHSQPVQSSAVQIPCSTSIDTLATTVQSPLPRIFHSSDSLSISSQWLKRVLKPSISMIVGVGGFVLACVALWSTVNATSDGRNAELLAEWTAKKDFIEFCQTASSDALLVHQYIPREKRLIVLGRLRATRLRVGQEYNA